MYPRIAVGDGFTPNLSGGGLTMIPKYFFLQEYAEDALDVQNFLKVFALQLANHLETLYAEQFDELGIDVGMDTDRRVWLFEVNWRPGPPPIWYVELDVARNSVGYAMYLTEQNKKSRLRT